MSRNRYQPNKEDSYLLTEQPAFGIIIAGFLISLFVGLGVRAFLSPQKMKILLEQQLTPISGQVTVTVDTAEISFAEGWVPRFSLIVRGMKLSSDNVCWFSPMGEIGQIELPVSFASILRGKIQIREIRISDSKFILRTDRSQCGVESSQTHLDWQAPKEPEPNPTFSTVDETAKPKINPNNRPPQIEKVNFKRLSLTFGGADARTLDFDEVILESGAEFAQYHLYGYLNLTGEKLLGGALALAQFDFNFEKEKVSAILKGNWREGHYHFSGDYIKDTDAYTVSGELKHLPVSEMMALAAKYGITSQPFNAKQLWASLNFSSKGLGKTLLTSPLQVQNFKLEGDLGEIHSSTIEFTSLKPLAYQPIDIKVLDLDLDLLVQALSKPPPSTTVAQLGKLNGDLKILSEKDFLFRGGLRNMQLIFSSRGQRRIQTIKSTTGQLAMKDYVFSAEVDNLALEGGEFLGQLSFSFNSEAAFFAFDLNLEKLKFNSEVENLMTAGGRMNDWSGKVAARLENRKILELRGQLLNDELDVEGTHIKKVALNLSSQGSEVMIRTQASQMLISTDSRAGSFLKPLLDPEQQSIALKEISGVIRQDAGTLKWQDWKAKSDNAADAPSVSWASEGGWLSDGVLGGVIQLRDGKKKSEWKITGARDEPKLEAKQ